MYSQSVSIHVHAGDNIGGKWRDRREFKIKRIRTPKENHQPAAIHSETLRKRGQEPKR